MPAQRPSIIEHKTKRLLKIQIALADGKRIINVMASNNPIIKIIERACTMQDKITKG